MRPLPIHTGRTVLLNVDSWLASRVARFCLSGGLATALHYLVMLSAMHAGSTANAATAMGAIAGAGANYLLQHRYTFRSTRNHVAASSRYTAAVLLGWLLNSAFFAVLHSGLSIHVYAAQVLTTLLLALCNYWIFKRYVFS